VKQKTTVRDIPIIFCTAMVLAILAGRKSQTRRLSGRYSPGDLLWVRETWGSLEADHPLVKEGRKPEPGDKLVYRADPASDYQWGDGKPSQGSFCWRPSIFMPRWASRISLKILNVTQEPLQDITTEDAKAEGIEGRWHPEDSGLWTWRDYRVPGRFAYGSMFGPRESFAGLWDSLNAKRGFPWSANPSVLRVEFRRTK
jgi:hypothetical protein